GGFLPYGYYGGYYGLGDGGLDYGYNMGAGAPAESAPAPSEPLAMALPPAPPPVSQGVTVETTPMGITIVRGHTPYYSGRSCAGARAVVLDRGESQESPVA